MTLHCPKCDSTAFKILGSVELGPIDDWDERTAQRARCRACGSRFICIYRERRVYHGDRDDVVEHFAYDTRSLVWFLSFFVFSKPQSRMSPRWRRVLLRKWVFPWCVGRGFVPNMPIKYSARP